MTQDPDDKALLKIVNLGEKTFYLESANCNIFLEEDLIGANR